jgi:hypothetical protein
LNGLRSGFLAAEIRRLAHACRLESRHGSLERLLYGVLLAACVVHAQQIYPTNLPNRQHAPYDNAVTRLGDRTISDLPSLLAAFGINPDSQMLVFSKTSFQASKIGPRNPRAIYFNDEVAVGWVRGGEGIEVAAVDSRQGVVFYTFNDGAFTHRQECLHCHYGPATAGVPGMFVGSVYPDAAGNPSRDQAIITDHRTPFTDRWGGWYVNAARGEQKDRANAVAMDPAEPHALASLAMKFNPAGYLSPTSDIVALMTFEHQTQFLNLLTRLKWTGADSDVEALARYMTFQDEAPLVEPIEGFSTFTKTFPQRGPRDRQGRSLRDFDLRTRLFRYPLSYMVYSPSFDALPAEVRARLWRRAFELLRPEDRAAVREILRDTRTDRALDAL